MKYAIASRTLWTAGGVAAVCILLWTVGARIVPELVLLFGAIVIAEGMRPLVAWLVRRRVPEPLAILAIVAVALASLVGLAWLILTPLVAQIASLLDDIPHFTAVAQRYLDAYQRFLQNNTQARQLLAQLPGRISAFVTSQLGLIIAAPIFFVKLVSNGFLVLLVVFFWLTASRELATFVLSFAPPTRRAELRDILNESSTKIGGYLRGVLINMVAIGLLSGIGVALLAVPYALLLGVVAALTEAIPIVGPLLGGSVAVVVALLGLGPQKAFQVAILYLVIQQIEGNTLVPFVMNRAVAMNPLTIVVALVIGSALLGIPGAILAVPAAAILQVVVLRIITPSLRIALTGDAASPISVPHKR